MLADRKKVTAFIIGILLSGAVLVNIQSLYKNANTACTTTQSQRQSCENSYSPTVATLVKPLESRILFSSDRIEREQLRLNSSFVITGINNKSPPQQAPA